MAYLAKGNPYAMNMGVGMGPVHGLHHHHHAQVGGGGMPGLAGLAMPPSAMDPLHSAVGLPPGMERTCKYEQQIQFLKTLPSIPINFEINKFVIVVCQGVMEVEGSNVARGQHSLEVNWTCLNLSLPRLVTRTFSCAKKLPSR